MSRQTSKAVMLAEQLLQELIWLSQDPDPADVARRRAGRPPEQQAQLEDALRPFELLTLVLTLKGERAFSHARQILSFLRNSQVSEPELRRVHGSRSVGEIPLTTDRYARQAMKISGDSNLGLRLAQLHSLCTYKDISLPARTRLEYGLKILGEGDYLSSTKDQETLGLAGAIYKRLWELDGRKENLERSFHYYDRGYQVGIKIDYGYTAINAAYVLDLLAKQSDAETYAAGLSVTVFDPRLSSVSDRRHASDQIRKEIVATLVPLVDQEDHKWLAKEWWFLVTLAEAFFGLGFRDIGYFQDATRWLERAAELPGVTDWEFESTARQLATLASLRQEGAEPPADPLNTEAFRVLRLFLKEKFAGIRATLAGKVGLAFSGGGFRAALFHIGVLAKLAELDMLRNVEVISCVSAGSIIGAHYYLEVRELLQSKKDAEITRDDYIALVDRVERDFLEGIQRNIRTRLAAELSTNLKAVFHPTYTRTDRLGELLEDLLYSRIGKQNRGNPLNLNELEIVPMGEDEATFTPADSNWRRAAKTPILVINATTLNTGHNWQFTTAWMGEPAASINPEIDRNPRLRRVRYAEAPAGYKSFRLGRAVAASTCTPGLLEPVTLEGLYSGMTLRLIDGVFQGGQGIAALLESDCNVLLVSDASGQAQTLDKPGSGLLDVFARGSNILLGHMRGRQHELLDARRRSSLIRGLMYLHLRKGLEAETRFAGESERTVARDESRGLNTSELTSYGVLKDVQERLARIRTDLDAFSDAEAYALMMSGYLMTAHEFESCVENFPKPEEIRPAWRFLAIEEPMKTVGNKQLIDLLDAASRQVFKFWHLSPSLRAFTALFGALFLILVQLLALFYFFRPGGAASFSVSSESLRSTQAYFPIVYGLLLALISYLAWLVLKKYKTPGQIIIGLGMSTVGFLFARVTLTFFDPWYLAKGRIGSLRAATSIRGQTWLGSLVEFISPARPIEYLSQKVDVGGSVKSIGRLVDHARAVEAVARLFEHAGYETARYPRDAKSNPLQLSLDLLARKGAERIFTSVRTRSESPNPVEWGAASELNAAISMLAEVGESSSESDVGARLVLVDAETDGKLSKFVEKARGRGARIELVTFTEAEVTRMAAAKPDDPKFEDWIRKLQLTSELNFATSPLGEAPLTGGAL